MLTDIASNVRISNKLIETVVLILTSVAMGSKPHEINLRVDLSCSVEKTVNITAKFL